MRRTIFMIIFLLLFTMSVAAQGGQRTASPPVVTVELSGIEPRPSNFPAEMIFGGVGGGGAEPLTPYGVYWETTPGAFAGGHDARFRACGYTTNQLPVATLAYPSGRT